MERKRSKDTVISSDRIRNQKYKKTGSNNCDSTPFIEIILRVLDQYYINVSHDMYVLNTSW